MIVMSVAFSFNEVIRKGSFKLLSCFLLYYQSNLLKCQGHSHIFMLKVSFEKIYEILCHSFVLFVLFYSFCTEAQGDMHIPFSVPTHTQRHTKDSDNTGNFMPCSFRIVCGFFNVPQWSYINMEGICETGPTVYRPYPRRLESLTICWFNYKGTLLSYFKTLSVGPAGVELATSHMTARCSTTDPPVRG